MKIPNSYYNTALIDADPIIWIACNGKKVLDRWGHAKKEDGKFVYTDKTVQEAIDTCDGYLKDVLNLTRADSYVLFLTTGQTFRAKLDPSYKANRAGFERPLWFQEVKDHLIKEWDAIEVSGLEADDMVNIAKTALENSFIIAADKDILECVPGRHFDARRNHMTFREIDYTTATFNFARSLLTGDTVDGVPNLIKGMGPKTAETELLRRMEYNNPITAALLIFINHLGQYEGIKRFANQYQLLKILETEEQLPEGVKFAVSELQINCWDCVETLLSTEHYRLKYLDEL